MPFTSASSRGLRGKQIPRFTPSQLTPPSDSGAERRRICSGGKKQRKQIPRSALSKVMQALKDRRGTACRTLGPRHSQEVRVRQAVPLQSSRVKSFTDRRARLSSPLVGRRPMWHSE